MNYISISYSDPNKFGNIVGPYKNTETASKKLKKKGWVYKILSDTWEKYDPINGWVKASIWPFADRKRI